MRADSPQRPSKLPGSGGSLPSRPTGNSRVLNVLAVLLIGVLVWAFGGKGRSHPPSAPATSPASAPAAPRTTPPVAAPPSPRASAPELAPASAPEAASGLIAEAAVENFGEVIYRGPIDLRATIERIRRGERLRFKDDGIVFGNREHLLPERRPGYYHEWVHPTDGLGGPGPQRVVTGAGGELFYTPNHYRSFQRVP